MRGRKAEIIPVCDAEPDGVPEPPADLGADALAEWHRTLPILLNERRTLTVADLSVFAAFCTAAGMVAEARRIVSREGLTYTGASGPKKHPAVGIANDAMTQMRQLAAELGLTPASRSRPAIRGNEGAADNDLFGGLL